MAAVELRTLGESQILLRGTPLGPQSPNAFALALYLGVERGRAHSREELLPLFFPDVPVTKGAHSLRQNLYKLRGLGLPCVTESSGFVVPAASVRDDYSSLLATGELPGTAEGGLPGGFLPSYWPEISADFTAWVEAKRDAVNSALRRAYVARIADRRAVARWDQVEAYARACLAIDPLNEEATLALAEALALSGAKAAGLKVLDDYVQEVGTLGHAVTLPATILRRRISERLRAHRSDWIGRMAGREPEVRQFNEVLGGAFAGQSASLWISGEPGIGKTRLLHELVCVAQLAGARVVSGVCQPHDVRRPLSVLADMAPALLTLPGALGCSPDALAQITRMTAKDAGAHADGHVPPAPAFATVSTQLSRAFSDLLDAISSEATVLVVIDDAQWLDVLSRQVIDDLIAERKDRRVLLLVGSRAARQPRAPRGPKARELAPGGGGARGAPARRAARAHGARASAGRHRARCRGGVRGRVGRGPGGIAGGRPHWPRRGARGGEPALFALPGRALRRGLEPRERADEAARCPRVPGQGRVGDGSDRAVQLCAAGPARLAAAPGRHAGHAALPACGGAGMARRPAADLIAGRGHRADALADRGGGHPGLPGGGPGAAASRDGGGPGVLGASERGSFAVLGGA